MLRPPAVVIGTVRFCRAAMGPPARAPAVAANPPDRRNPRDWRANALQDRFVRGGPPPSIGRRPRAFRVRTLDTAALRSTLNSAGVQLDQVRANLAAGALDSAMAAASQARDGVTKVLKAIEKATGKPTSPKR